MVRTRLGAAVLVCTAVWVAVVGCNARRLDPNAESPICHIETRRAGNSVEAEREQDVIIVAVESESGIGEAAVECLSHEVGGEMVVRLYLHGLERFQVSYDGIAIVASVASHGDHAIRQSVSGSNGDAKNEEALDPHSRYWMHIRHASPESAQGGISFFDVKLPQDLIARKDAVFSLQ